MSKDQGKESTTDVQHWLKEISSARQREKDFRKNGKKICELYTTKQTEGNYFNILFSNTETLAPALYNAVPRPFVQRRFKDEDPLGKVASNVVQRTLEYLLDADMREYPTVDDLFREAVLGALVPGRGITRFKYDAIFNDGAVSTEYVCGENVPWDRFLHGYATTWREVPWVCFEWPMSEKELRLNFKELAGKCELVNIENPNNKEEGEHSSSQQTTKGAWVYEIWDKATKKVFFITDSYKEGVLREVDDPLGLSGFFPCPRPLTLVPQISSLTPVALYAYYKNQAQELNTITLRIDRIVHALKVRGFYDSSFEGLDKLLSADDNTLIPVPNAAALNQGSSLENILVLLPIDKLITVLQQLYAQREQIKRVIYEITGIADIMRGSTNASETLGAQELKNQWGTLRLKKAQKEVMRYVKDCLRIMAEIAVTKLQPATIKAMTSATYPLPEEKVQASQIVELSAQQGQEPPPQVTGMLQQPDFGQILALLRDDLQRSYRIDIETNSTVDAEATEDKEDMAELMNAFSQFLNGIAPAVQGGIMPFDAAKSILIGIVRKFRFGSDIEDLLKGMQAPPPPQPEPPKGDPPEVVKAKAEATMQEIQLKQQTMQMEAEQTRAEHAMRMQEMQLKHRITLIELEAKVLAAQAKPAGVTKQ